MSNEKKRDKKRGSRRHRETRRTIVVSSRKLRQNSLRAEKSFDGFCGMTLERINEIPFFLSEKYSRRRVTRFLHSLHFSTRISVLSLSLSFLSLFFSSSLHPPSLSFSLSVDYVLSKLISNVPFSAGNFNTWDSVR